MNWDAATTVVAALALILSVVSLVWNWRLSSDHRQLAKEQLQAHREARQLDKESKERANIRAYLTKERLNLINDSEAPAYGVSVDLRSEARGTSPFPSNLNAFPIEALLPGQEFPLMVCMTMDCYPPFEARITWKDPSGEARESRLILNV